MVSRYRCKTDPSMPSPATAPTGTLPGPRRPTSTASLLHAHQLAFCINGRMLWKNLDLALARGERLAIGGATGSGKTVLLRTLAGLEPLQAGTIYFNDQALSSWSMPAYRARVVYVPQRPALAESTVKNVLQSPFKFRVRRDQPFPLQLACEHLAALGRNSDFLTQRAERLSGGEAQIVAVLRALLVASDILLLDEPTASLDAEATAGIETLIARWLGEQSHRACIWTSHDRSQLARISDRTLALGEAE